MILLADQRAGNISSVLNRNANSSEISDSLVYQEMDDTKIRNLEAQVQQKIDNINKLEHRLKINEIS